MGRSFLTAFFYLLWKTHLFLLPARVHYFSNSVTVLSLVNIRIFCHSFNFFSDSFSQKITILLLMQILSFSTILTNFHPIFVPVFIPFSPRYYPIFTPFLSHFCSVFSSLGIYGIVIMSKNFFRVKYFYIYNTLCEYAKLL